MKTLRQRRKSAKTDYRARFALLKSEKPRLIIRKTNRFMIAQIVESEIAQDKVLATANSKELLAHGWPKEKTGSLKTLAASYLTGFLLVKKLKNLPNEVILDIGMNRNIHGSRIYAVLKGALDAGLKISHDEKSLPSIERITSNENTKTIFTRIKEKI